MANKKEDTVEKYEKFFHNGRIIQAISMKLVRKTIHDKRNIIEINNNFILSLLHVGVFYNTFKTNDTFTDFSGEIGIILIIVKLSVKFSFNSNLVS